MKNFLISFVFTFIVLADLASSKEINRSVLALWDSTELPNTVHKSYTFSKLHMRAEVILNHLGLKLDYIDVNEKIPDEFNHKYIISWFSDNKIRNPRKYLKWLNRQIDNGKKVVILGELGFFEKGSEKSVSLAEVNKLFKKLGVSHTGEVLGLGYKFRPVFHRDRKDSEFERTLKNEMSHVQELAVINNKAVKPWTSVKSKKKKREIPVVFLHENGGYASSGYEIFLNPENYSTQWRINPFKFFREAFQLEKFPIPDTTTLCGKRIFYSHIDGDGFINVSKIDKKSLSAKIIKDEILEKYNVGIGVSVISAEISPEHRGGKKAMNLAREIFKMKNVEPASHTYTHPLSWERNPSPSEQDTYLGKGKRRKGAIVAYPVWGNRIDYKKETLGSLSFIDENLLSNNKKSKMLFWSGSCMPPESALKFLENKGYLNINGGDARFDSIYPTYGKLSPIYRKVGDLIQVYASTTNENLFTNLWSENFGGFKKAVETFKNTESPHRIKPINIYYHFYSGEKQSALNALKSLYGWSVKQDINPIFTSDYIKIALDFPTIKIQKLGENEFYVTGMKNLKTLRLDIKDEYPDFSKSSNVLGFKRENNSIYLHIGEKDQAKIVLTKKAPSEAYIESCNGFPLKLNKAEGSLSLDLRLPGYLDEKVVVKNSRDLNVKVRL